MPEEDRSDEFLDKHLPGNTPAVKALRTGIYKFNLWHRHAGQLAAYAGRVGDWTEQIEHRSDPNLTAWPDGVAHGGVKDGRKHEAEAGPADAGGDLFGR